MNILISGGAGYIGSSLAHFLIKKKFNVTIIDNLSTGYKNLIPRKASFIQADGIPQCFQLLLTRPRMSDA